MGRKYSICLPGKQEAIALLKPVLYSVTEEYVNSVYGELDQCNGTYKQVAFLLIRANLVCSSQHPVLYEMMDAKMLRIVDALVPNKFEAETIKCHYQTVATKVKQKVAERFASMFVRGGL